MRWWSRRSTWARAVTAWCSWVLRNKQGRAARCHPWLFHFQAGDWWCVTPSSQGAMFVLMSSLRAHVLMVMPVAARKYEFMDSLSRMFHVLQPEESGCLRPVFIMVRFVCKEADDWISVVDHPSAHRVHLLLKVLS